MGAHHLRHVEGVASAPLSWANPTIRRIPVGVRPITTTHEPAANGGTQKDPASHAGLSQANSTSASAHKSHISQVQHRWRSRDNRKGRHMIAITPAAHADSQFVTPRPTMSPKEIIKGIWRMCSVFPYWDVSYLVAIAFTIGSITWCFNGFFAWLPLQDPGSEFPTEALYGAGITAFIGATIFEIGSVLLMVEAVNEDRSDCFGWALEGAVEEGGLARLHPGRCSHHHRNRHNFVGKGETAQSEIPLDEPGISKSHPHPSSARSWTWWPTWYELRTRYMRDIGFLASLSQFIGASIFWISGFTALPGINNNLSPAALDGAFWAPQVVGGTGFIVSGTLFMLETQKKWYTPALGVLGWHVGFWNLIGAIGFTLCGALGFSSGSGELYQSSLATFWGSWAFLIGSLLQWYESLDKYPVVIEAVSGFSSSSASTSEQDGGKK